MYSKFTIHGNLPMIQIQDDPINQISLSSNQAVAPDAQASIANSNQSANFPAPAANPVMTDGSVSASNSDSNPTDNKITEIDKLLAELDKLSKNMEEKQAAGSEKVSETMPSEGNDKKSENFDFDSFLSDLETKIDSESKNQQSQDDRQPDQQLDQQLDQEEFDFRKNRFATDVQSEEEKIVDAAIVGEQSFKDDDEQQANQNGKESSDEELKLQNIFEMLGLMKVTDDEKNKFLDELEVVIWDDFVDHDLELLLTSEEYADALKIINESSKTDEEKKENLIIYLEKFIPDLDEILYDKAMELKSEMMAERLMKMKENADENTLSKIKEAERMISQNLWKSAASLLNQLS